MVTKKKDNRKRKVMAATVIVALLLILASTYMWWTSESHVVNALNLGHFDVVPIEKFPDGDVEPGLTLKKEVYAANRGTADAAVRMSFKESIEFVEYNAEENRLKMTFLDEPGLQTSDGKSMLIVKYAQEATDIILSGGYVKIAEDNTRKAIAYEKDLGEGESDVIAFAEVTGGYQIASYDKESGKFKFAYYVRGYKKFGPEMYGTSTALGTDQGVTEYEMNKFRDYVTLNFDNMSLASEEEKATDWKQLNGYFYYTKKLASGKQTSRLLNTVTFKTNLPDSWQGAQYVIDVKAEAVQAVRQAVSDTWGADAAKLINGLADGAQKN